MSGGCYICYLSDNVLHVKSRGKKSSESKTPFQVAQLALVLLSETFANISFGLFPSHVTFSIIFKLEPHFELSV